MFVGTKKGGLFFSPGAGVRPVRRQGDSGDFSPFIFGKYRGFLPNATFGPGKKSHQPNFALGKYLANAIFGQFISLLRFGLCVFGLFCFITAIFGPKNAQVKYKNWSNEIISSKTRKEIHSIWKVLKNRTNEIRIRQPGPVGLTGLPKFERARGPRAPTPLQAHAFFLDP